MKLQTYDLSYLLGKSFFGDYGFQNMFVYQPSLRTLQLKKDNEIDYVISCKSKCLCGSILSPQNYAFKTFLDIK